MATRKFKGFTATDLTQQEGLVTTELVVEQNVSIPKHHHRTRQKAYYVIEGSCLINVGGRISPYSAGSSAAIPAGMIHAITTRDEKVRILVCYTHPEDDAIWEDEKPQLLI